MSDQNVKYLVFDIESIPNGSLIKDVKYPDENISDKEAIEKFQNEIMAITNNQSNFIPVTFQVPVSLVIAKVNKDFRLIEVLSLDEPNFRAPEIARKFWHGLETLYPDATLVTFNGRGFDVPLLEIMAFKYALPAKKHFTNKGGTRYRNGNQHIDLQEVMSNFGAVKMAGGLNLLAKLIGKPGKTDTKGSEVYDLYLKGDIARINDYCVHDVLDTYFIFLRTRVLFGQVSSEQEKEIIDSAFSYLKDNSNRVQAFKSYIKNMGA